MAVNDTSQLAVRGTYLGQMHLHTLHFRALAVGSGEQTLINEWQAGCRTAYRAIFQNDQPIVELITAIQLCVDIPLRSPF